MDIHVLGFEDCIINVDGVKFTFEVLGLIKQLAARKAAIQLELVDNCIRFTLLNE